MYNLYLFLSPPGSFNPDFRPPETLFKVIFWLGYFNSCLNPIIYPCYSRQFKLAFIRILRLVYYFTTYHITVLLNSSASSDWSFILQFTPRVAKYYS